MNAEPRLASAEGIAPLFPLHPLQDAGGYQVIYADPPWKFRSNRDASTFEQLEAIRGVNGRAVPYPTMTLHQIRDLPVRQIVAPQAVLFMWITGPFLAIGAHLPIMKAWGFKPKAMGFTWVKLKRSKTNHELLGFLPADLHVGLGLTTRKNAEFCIIGTRGKSLRQSRSVHEVGVFPLREHSRKPVEFRQRIETYVGPGLRMAEMFSREPAPGWETFGNETAKFADRFAVQA